MMHGLFALPEIASEPAGAAWLAFLLAIIAGVVWQRRMREVNVLDKRCWRMVSGHLEKEF